jgi:hypothetical protein
MQWLRRRRLSVGCAAVLLAAVLFSAWAQWQGSAYWNCKLGEVPCYVSDRPDLTNDAGRSSFWGVVRRANLYLELAAGVDPWMVDDVRIAWVAPGRAQTMVVRFTTSCEQTTRIARRGTAVPAEEFGSFLRTGSYVWPGGTNASVKQELAYLPEYPFSRLRWWPPEGARPNDLDYYLVTVPSAGAAGSSVPRWAGVMVTDSRRGLVWIAGPYLGKSWREARPSAPDAGRRTEAVPASRRGG